MSMSANARMTANPAGEPVLSLDDVRIGFDTGNVLDGLSFSVTSAKQKY